MTKKNLLSLTILILSVSVFRYFNFVPNFSPLISMSIFMPKLIKNIYQSLVFIFLTLLISDLSIGMYKYMYLNYIIYFLISIYSYRYFVNFNLKETLKYSLIASIVFFIFSNTFFWMTSGIYEKTINGYLTCITMGLPFFQNTILSTIIFSIIFYYACFIKNKAFLFKFK